MSFRRSTAAQLPTSVESGVEALRQLRIQLAGLHVAKPRGDVQPDQVLISLPRCHLQVGDFQPLVDRLSQRDRGLGVL